MTPCAAAKGNPKGTTDVHPPRTSFLLGAEYRLLTQSGHDQSKRAIQNSLVSSGSSKLFRLPKFPARNMLVCRYRCCVSVRVTDADDTEGKDHAYSQSNCTRISEFDPGKLCVRSGRGKLLQPQYCSLCHRGGVGRCTGCWCRCRCILRQRRGGCIPIYA